MTDCRDRVIFVKFSTSRSRAHSFKTVLSEQNGEICVRKVPMFSEAAEALNEMREKKDLLPAAFPGCEVCGCTQEGAALRFEYIRGSSLAETYWRAYQTNDRELFFANVDRHLQLLFGNTENECFFTPSPEFESLFGSRYPYEGLNGIKCTNFEATAFNIIFEEQSQKPVFFDYECIYDFPMPTDLVKYHCIYRTLYLCMPFLRSFVAPADFLAHLNLLVDEKVLERSWKQWRNNFSFSKKTSPKLMEEQLEETDDYYDDSGNVLSKMVSNKPEGRIPEAGTAKLPETMGSNIAGDTEAQVITLSAAKDRYAKRFIEVKDMNAIRNAINRRENMKKRLKKILPASVYSLMKKTYRRVKKNKRKGM